MPHATRLRTIAVVVALLGAACGATSTDHPQAVRESQPPSRSMPPGSAGPPPPVQVLSPAPSVAAPPSSTAPGTR